jgi:hypothetical protein
MNARRLPPREEDEETFDPLHVDDRNFYKVEKWTKGREQNRAHAPRRQ